MKKQTTEQIKMADLLLVHFAFIPDPARKERQFRLPDDFSGLDFTISLHTDGPSRVRFSRAFSSFFQHEQRGDLQNFLQDEDRARSFNISALGCKSCRLLAALM